MPRRSLTAEKRRDLLPVIARAFTRLGYRRTTTAELAKRCGVRENVLYRVWPSKKAMFLAAIEYVYDYSEDTWLRLLAGERRDGGTARRLLEFESTHHGEFGHYRILFTALGETDDPDIRAALERVYTRFHRFLVAQILAHRGGERSAPATRAVSAKNRRGVSAELSAWALIGLGTVANICREVSLISAADRRRMIAEVGRTLLEGGAA